MKGIVEPITNWLHMIGDAWNQFWFSSRSGQTLSAMRICVGLIGIWTLISWCPNLETFFGSQSIVPVNYRSLINGGSFAWSHFDWIGDTLLWPAHLAAIAILILFTVGAMTRVTSILTALIMISYANRSIGVQFGLDQITCFLCLYLALGNCGSHWSVDRWRDGGRAGESVLNNVALRLVQLHMCVVYFFAGVGKLQGTTWLGGEAIWWSLASHEYQTLDMTWLAGWMWLVNITTLVTLFWEVSYPFLVWPRLSRPLVLVIALFVHLGIGICMGMLSFGLIMLTGNIAFLSFGRWPISLAAPSNEPESNQQPKK